MTRAGRSSTDGALGLALFDDRYLQDPYPLYERMHEAGSVHRIGNSDFYAVSSWDAVCETVSRSDDFSSNLTATMMYQPGGSVAAFTVGKLGGPTQALATADDPAHSIHRKALLGHLAAKRIRACEPFIAQTSADLWRANAHTDGIEWMDAVSNRLPMMIVGRIIGIPDTDVDKLIRWGYSATQLLDGLVTHDQMATATTAVLELSGYIAEQFRQAATNPQDDLLGDLATACAAGEIDDAAALTIMITLFSAGGESTASLIGSAAWILATQPHVQRQVRDQPRLLRPFLEEALRYEPPFRGHYRHVLNDTELRGTDLPAGSRLLLLWGAANRDPSHFDDPQQFRLDRPTGKSHLAFGKGAHFCVGAALARLEAEIVLGHLLDSTSTISTIATGRWLPSLLVRRLESLHLSFA